MVPNPDLVASVDLTAGQTWLPGQKVTVPITVTNNGLDPAHGAVTVNLFRSTDNVFDDPQSAGSPDVQVGTLTGNVNLVQGQSQQFMISFVVPGNAQPGAMYPIAQVVASSAIEEVVTSNNVGGRRKFRGSRLAGPAPTTGIPTLPSRSRTALAWRRNSPSAAKDTSKFSERATSRRSLFRTRPPVPS